MSIAAADGAILDRKLVRGITWTGAIKGGSLFISWASVIFVARILAPGDYGLVAMATVYLGFTTIVADFGLGYAVVALRPFDSALASQLHTVAALVGAAAMLVSLGVAFPLSRFYGVPALVPVLMVLSSTLLLDSLRVVPMALLARELRFELLAMFDGVKVLTSVAITVVLALAGARHWALVAGIVGGSAAATLGVALCSPAPFAWPKFEKVRGALRFSSRLLTSQLASYGYMNADFVVAGRILGRVALGEYTLAWNLTSAPVEKVMSVFGRVMPSMLAAVQHDVAALRRYFLLYTEAMAILIVPPCIGLALVAPEFIPTVFGPQWTAAVLPLQLLAMYISIHLPTVPMMPLLQVTKQEALPARWAVLALIVLTPVFLFCGSRWGTVGIAGAWVVVFPPLLVPVFFRVFRTLQLRVRDYLACIAPTVASVCAMAVSVLIARSSLPPMPPVTRVVALIGIGAATFVAAGLFLFKKRLASLAEFLRAARS